MSISVSVLGCGRWGSLIGWYLNSIGHNVTLWGLPRSLDTQNLLKNRKNNLLTFDERIRITDDLTFALNGARDIIISISSQNLRFLMEDLSNFDLSSCSIILCMKGIEESTGLRLTEIVREFVPKTTKIGVWVGPGHVQNFIDKIPNCMIFDSKNRDIIEYFCREFSCEFLRVIPGNDLIGTEIGAAAKNVMGIAAGMLDGIGYESLKGPLMTFGTLEVSNLISAMGGNPASAYGLCHLGDFQATLFSKYSNNRMYGESFVRNISCEKLAEGVGTTKALKLLSAKYSVNMPICESIYRVLFEGKKPKDEIMGLMHR